MDQEKELWKKCIEWLVSSSILDVSASLKITKPADLASILRDGVLLCELVLKFLPGCIDRNEMFLQYEENCKSSFMRAKNISLFLTVCQTHFGLTELFDCNDLYDLEDFGRVLQVLSQLSHSPQAKKFNLKPFSDECLKNLSNNLNSENIYCNLREEVEELTADSLNFRDAEDQSEHYGFIGTFHENKHHREKLYDSILAQKTPSTKLIPKKYTEFKPINERGHCLRELLDTESNYCEALSMIIEKFYNKLKFQITIEDLETIFMNIKEIYQVHQCFLKKLAPAVLQALGIENSTIIGTADVKDNLSVADVFLLFKMQFLLYAQYCAWLKASASRIDELERSRPEIWRLIIDLSKTANQNQFKLRDLLVIPMQRILKYPLLLKELVRTSTDVQEQARLDAAYEAMKDVSTYINEMKRDHEKIEVITTVQRSVTSYETHLKIPFTKYGRLLQDGAVRLTDNEEGTSRSKQRYLFLFEKILMICKQKGGLYEFRKAHFLPEYDLLENDQEISFNKNNTISRRLTSGFFDNISVTLIKKTNFMNGNKYNGNNGLNSSFNNELLTISSNINSSSVTSTIQLIFKSIQQRNEWKKELKNALEINNPPLGLEKGHSLIYKTYNCAVVCSICRKLLVGKFYQGYHCSNCNRDMHFDCCHIQFCTTKQSSSLKKNQQHCSNSFINFHPNSIFHVGDLVVATKKVTPSSTETNFLSLKHGDLIEITDVDKNDGTIIGRLSHCPGKIGIISSNDIARTSDTLKKTVEKSRHSANSFSDIVFECVLQSKILVSRAIISLFEDAGVLELNDQPWFFGNLEREKASQLLEKTENGTFLVRYSLQQQKYVISLRYDGREKHMLIQCCLDSQKYYLHDSRFFDTIVELINFYRRNNLNEGFVNLDGVLGGTPLKSNTYRVIQSYEKDNETYLSLQVGDIVTVLETNGEQKGWWKGSVNGKIGFFPISFVTHDKEFNNINSMFYNHSLQSKKSSNIGNLNMNSLSQQFQNSLSYSSTNNILSDEPKNASNSTILTNVTNNQMQNQFNFKIENNNIKNNNEHYQHNTNDTIEPAIFCNSSIV